MLHGMYDFTGTNEKTLSFQLNESLLYLGPHPKTNNWLRASNARGQVGIVPVNYISIGHDFNGEVVMEFLNGAIRRSQRDNSPKIDQLLKLRDRLLNSTTDLKDQIIELEDEIRRSRQIAIAELGGKDVSYLAPVVNTPPPNQSSSVPCRLAGELIEGVRNSTGLSHELSQIAVQTVLQCLQGHFHGFSEQLNSLMGYLEKPCAIRQYPSLIAQSADAIQLRKVFNQLTECKDDEQQRSWALHEDEAMILDNIRQLNTILDNADQSISKFVMQENHYTSVHALVLYYQMETRWSIRQVLLDSFAFMSVIDGKALSVLLNSILPMELAREIQLNGCELERLVKTANLLALLLSTGEPMPITHYEHLGTDFLHFVLSTIENPPNDDEQVTDIFMNLVLAYNLEFKPHDNNFTIQALSEVSNAKVFTQKMIYLLNWEKDPIAIKYAHDPNTPNSIFKLLTDIFTNAKTADLFYQNDVKVLIDIVTRCLTDLGPGDKRRTSYLNLIRVVFRNSNYCEHRHRRDDLLKCFTSIMMEDDPLSLPDQKLLKEITQEFPAIVK